MISIQFIWYKLIDNISNNENNNDAKHVWKNRQRLSLLNLSIIRATVDLKNKIINDF